MSIKALSDEIRQKIRAGIAINSVSQCVEELVQNSLDAGATCIAVRLDLQFFKIQVVDNGSGISYADLKVAGDRYSTSKCFTLSDLDNTRYYGYRGEALASICEVSSDVTVVSELLNTDTTHVKTISSSSSQTGVNLTNRRASHGTTVTVWGFLHNMPVRQATIDVVIDTERTRKSLESLALVHPHVSFSLHDNGANVRCVAVPKTGSVPRTFGHLFGSHWVSQLQWCTQGEGPYVVSGYLTARGHRNRNLQFLFVHRRRIVGHRLQKSISEMIEKHAWSGGALNVSMQRSSAIISPTNATRSPGKQTRSTGEMFPVFLLDIKCPRKYYDVGLHPTKTVIEFRNYDDLIAIAKDLVTKFFNIPNVEHFTPVTVPQYDSDGMKQANSTDNPYGEIAVQNVKHSMHSLPVKRPYQATVLAADKVDARLAASGIKRPMLNSLEPSHTPEAHHTESDLDYDILAIMASIPNSDVRQNQLSANVDVSCQHMANQAPKFTNVRSRLMEQGDISEDPMMHRLESLSSQFVDVGSICDNLRPGVSGYQRPRDRPIRLTKALCGGEPTALSKLSRYKAQSERIANALNDLKKFSFARSAPSQTASEVRAPRKNSATSADLSYQQSSFPRRVNSMNSTGDASNTSTDMHNHQIVSMNTVHPRHINSGIDCTTINKNIRSSSGSGQKIATSHNQLTNAITFTQIHVGGSNANISQNNAKEIQNLSDQALSNGDSVSRFHLRELEFDRGPSRTITTRDVTYSTNQVTLNIGHPIEDYNREEQLFGNDFQRGMPRSSVRLDPSCGDDLIVENIQQMQHSSNRFTGLLSKPRSSTDGANDTQPFEMIDETQPFAVTVDDRHSSFSSTGRETRANNSNVANSQASISRFGPWDKSSRSISVSPSPHLPLHNTAVAADSCSSTQWNLEACSRDGMIGNLLENSLSIAVPCSLLNKTANAETLTCVAEKLNVSGDHNDNGTESLVAVPSRNSSVIGNAAKSPQMLLESSSRLVTVVNEVSASSSVSSADCGTTNPQVVPETSSEDIANPIEVALQSSSMDIDNSEESSRDSHNGGRAVLPLFNAVTLPERQDTRDESSGGAAASSSESHFFTSWISGVDAGESRRKVFIDRISGNSYFEDPESVVSSTAVVVEETVPDKLAIGEGEIPLSASALPSRPWRVRPPSSQQNESNVLTTRPQTQNPEVQAIALMLKTWNNPVFRLGQSEVMFADTEISCEASKLLSSRYKRPYVFDKSIFDNIQVISQVDHKFIACMVHYQHPECSNSENREPNVLVLFDQHAVHERIRLEELLADNDSAGFVGVRETPMEPPLELTLPSAVVRVALAHNSRNQFVKCGLYLSATASGEADELLVHAAPECLVERDRRELKMNRPSVIDGLLENLIWDLVEDIELNGTIGSTMPKVILNTLKSYACKAAIKFGDPLTHSECTNLIKDLKTCKLPFHCAHGRPSIAPLADLDELRFVHVHEEKETTKLSFKNLKLNLAASRNISVKDAATTD